MKAVLQRLLGPIARFGAWWGGLFVLLGGGTTCPFCGSPSFPGGPPSAGFLSGLTAVFLVGVRRIRRRFRRVPPGDCG